MTRTGRILLGVGGGIVFAVAWLSGEVPAAKWPAAASGDSRAAPALSAGNEATVTVPAATGSLYDLDLTVIGADGARHRLDESRGHPLLATMFFASCPSVCPALIAEVKQLEATLPAALRADTRVLLVSFDPGRDTPAVLADVIRRHALDASRWRVAVAADEDGARALAGTLGIRYREDKGALFSHTTRVVAFDRAGKAVAATDDPVATGAQMAERLAAAR
jgi:protein SCO1/2